MKRVEKQIERLCSRCGRKTSRTKEEWAVLEKARRSKKVLCRMCLWPDWPISKASLIDALDRRASSE